MKLTQKNFNQFLDNQTTFVEALNHRMTRIEMDVKWIKRIGYYLTGVLSLAVGKFLIGI